MDTMDMISKALEAVVEQKVAERSATNLDSVLEFVRNANRSDLEKILSVFAETTNGTEVLDDKYRTRRAGDDSVLVRDDITGEDVVELVGQMDLDEFIFNEYWDNLGEYDKKEFIKDVIDRL